MNNQRGTGFLGNIPTITKNIIIINVIFWFAEFVLSKRGIDLAEFLGLHFFKASDFGVYQFLTYMFLHQTTYQDGSIYIWHILSNMFALFMFGPSIEHAWGSKRFLVYYLTTGIGAGIVQQLAWMIDLRSVLFDGLSATTPDMFNPVITVGASGAVFGVLLAFGILFPNAQLMLLFPPIPMKAKWFVIGYGVMELFMGVANFSGDNVAHFAHLGGMLFGIILILYWRKKDRSHGHFY